MHSHSNPVTRTARQSRADCRRLRELEETRSRPGGFFTVLAYAASTNSDRLLHVGDSEGGAAAASGCGSLDRIGDRAAATGARGDSCCADDGDGAA